ncbi:Phosphatidylinositol (PI) 3-kinase, partial [Spiromyces aspiralis]
MFSMHPRFCRIYDPEMYRENLVEAKHRRLMRGHHSGPLSRELKPDAKTRDQLESIIRYPPLRRLNDQEKDLLWKFRYYLSSTPKALTKFMSCVDWSDPWESKQALSLLNNWERVDVDDALALLGPGFAHPSIRAFAVQQLEKASDEDLNLYLLQLVQALRFDAAKPDGSSSRHGRLGHMSDTDNVAIGGGGSSSAADALGSGPVDLGNGGGTTTQESSSQSTAALQPETEPSRLAQFLIERSLKNECLGNYFHWYLMIECEDREVGKMYGKIAFQYMHAMMETP